TLHGCGLADGGVRYHMSGIVEANVSFLADQLACGFSRVLCLHAGTRIVPTYACFLLSLYCIVRNELTADHIVRQLSKGARVIYRRKRGRYLGINDDGNAMIEQARGVMNYVPPPVFYLIKPYAGTATTLDGRGIRTNPSAVRRMIASLVSVSETDVPPEIRGSIVVVVDRETADKICATEVIAPSGDAMRFSNIIPCAYCTPSDVQNYAGNASNSEPVLKFTNSVSIANEMVIDDEDGQIRGVVLCSRHAVESGMSDLEPMVSRSLPEHLWILGELHGYDWTDSLRERFPDMSVFVWSPKALQQQHSQPAANCEGSEDDENRRLATRIGIILNSIIDEVLVDAPIAREDYLCTLRCLWQLRQSDYGSDGRDLFVGVGYSLLRSLSSCVFPMGILEREIQRGNVRVASPQARLATLESVCESSSGVLGELMRHVYDRLAGFYTSLGAGNPKCDQLAKELASISDSQRAVVVLRKQYYAAVLRAALLDQGNPIGANIEFVTGDRFDRDKDYDIVISTGPFRGRRFNPASCICASKVKAILYGFEKEEFLQLRQEVRTQLRCYDSRNLALTKPVAGETLVPEDPPSADLHAELESFVRDAQMRIAVESAAGADPNQSTVRVYRVATFESGEVAFFTKNYTAYVFDSLLESVAEAEVSDLTSGDTLVFTNLGGEVRDIVDAVLEQYVRSNRDDADLNQAYHGSKLWKEILRTHIDRSQGSFRDVAVQMRKMGCARHEVTIRAWLDDDSRIVGPRDLDSFKVIACITNDERMLERPDAFFEACNCIRSIRTRILKHIGASIVRSLGNRDAFVDPMLESAVGDVSRLACILQIADLSEPENLSVPPHFANRPLAQP
ncbi:MAG: DrmE family protein, partial [Bacillota bacterium]